MNVVSESDPHGLSRARRIEPICDEFEAAWRRETRPVLEEYLERGEAADRAVLLRELLAIEWHYRRRRGDACTWAEYRRRFPELGENDTAASSRSAGPSGAPVGSISGTLGRGEQGRGEQERGEQGQGQGQGRGEPATGESTAWFPGLTEAPRPDRYRILALHARGGMGEVWTAQDESLGRRVAYKRMRAGRGTFQERFLAEAQITGQLEHPGIVPVHESGRDAAGRPFYVMRFVEGRTLKFVIADAHAAMELDRWSSSRHWLQLLEIFLTLCRTVAFAHHRGVIHRDIKPDNVMVGEFGETILLDWGLAKVVGAPDFPTGEERVRLSGGRDSSATQDGNVLGSPQYMPPELADGRATAGDVRTDVYLLGATLYEILTKRPPRQGGSQVETVELARTTSPPPANRVNPLVPKPLAAICEKAMARQKAQRYSSAQTLAEDVERYLAGDPVGAYRESWSERCGRWMRRHRRALGRGAAAILATTALAIAWVMAQDARQRAERYGEQLRVSRMAAQAEADHRDLRRTSERLFFALADGSSPDDRWDSFDPVGVDRWRILVDEIATRWKSDLSDFPLEDRRDEFRQGLVTAALWRIQQESLFADSERAGRLLRELDAIVACRPSPVSFHRLRATCLSQAGQSELAEVALTLARQASPTALDHFLLAEQRRVAARSPFATDQERDERGALREAIVEYRRCLELEPTHVWARLQKGRCHLLCGEPDQALSELDVAVAVAPELPGVWTVRGFASMILKSRTAAERDLAYALELDPDFEPARLNLGAVALSWNDTTSARTHFQTTLARRPDSVAARYYLAFADYLDGRHEAALERCETLCRGDARWTAPQLLAVQIRLAEGHASAARAALDAWLSASSNGATSDGRSTAARRCHMWRILAPRQLGAGRRLAWEQAIVDGRAALEAGGATAQLYDDVAGAYLALGKSNDALATLAAGVAAEGSETTRARLQLKRGLALVQQGDGAAARTAYASAAGCPGADPECQLIRAEAHAMLGYVAAREKSFDTAQREAMLAASQLRQTNHYTLWINLACVFNTLADHSQDGPDDELQSAALEMLANAMFQARRAGREAEAAQLVRADDALRSLKTLPRFREIVAGDSN